MSDSPFAPEMLARLMDPDIQTWNPIDKDELKPSLLENCYAYDVPSRIQHGLVLIGYSRIVKPLATAGHDISDTSEARGLYADP